MNSKFFPSAECLSLIHAIFFFNTSRLVPSVYLKIGKEENTKRFHDQWKGLGCYLDTFLSAPSSRRM